EVVEPGMLLARLVRGTDDLRRIALVESAPASGFTGAAANPAGAAVDLVTDDPEHVVLRVTAPARGFGFLADEYFPGWRATVNGTPAAILRGNYAFRLVEVPEGVSSVEFRYAPASVRIGAAVSGATVLALCLWALSGRAARR